MATGPASVGETPIRSKRKKPNDDSPDILSKPVDVCGHCGETCTSGKGHLSEAIQCDLCASWVHASWEGIGLDDYKLLTSLTSATDNVIYYCNLNQCLSRTKQIIFQHFNQSSKNTESSQPSLASEQQNLRDSVSALSNKINQLCTNNEQLQNQLNSTVSSLSEQAHKASDVSPSSLKVIDEYMDRERCKSNLIIYGLPEASAPTGAARQSADLNSLHELVRSEFR